MNLSRITDWLFVLLQYSLPHHALSGIVHKIARWRCPLLKNILIRAYIRVFDVDMGLACEPGPENYDNFNQFFTRALKPSVRVVNREGITCPVDGFVSQLGGIKATELFQAKGHYYDLEQLLASDNKMVEQFRDGAFATLYLSPADYHRVHMPLQGKLNRLIYVPGKLFSVNARTTRLVKNLFTRNERIISLFETDVGPMAIIMVGAILVGSMDTVWCGRVKPEDASTVTSWSYDGNNNNIILNRGDEMGRFNMGSTVILLLGNKNVEWNAALHPDSRIEMGTCLGKIRKA